MENVAKVVGATFSEGFLVSTAVMMIASYQIM